MWFYIAQQNNTIHYVHNHQLSERSMIEKDSLSERKLYTQKTQQDKDDQKELKKQDSISIDTLLSELNIAY